MWKKIILMQHHSKYYIIMIFLILFCIYDNITKKTLKKSKLYIFLLLNIQKHIERDQRATTKYIIDMHTSCIGYYLCGQLFTTRRILGRPFKNLACWCTWHNIIDNWALPGFQSTTEKLKILLDKLLSLFVKKMLH